MEPNTLIYALNEFKVIYRKIILIIDTIFVNYNNQLNSGVGRQPYSCKICVLLGYIWFARYNIKFP